MLDDKNSLNHIKWNCKYHDTAGKNAKKIAEYMQNQLKEDQIRDQMTIRAYKDPFTGGQ